MEIKHQKAIKNGRKKNQTVSLRDWKGSTTLEEPKIQPAGNKSMRERDAEKKNRVKQINKRYKIIHALWYCMDGPNQYCISKRTIGIHFSMERTDGKNMLYSFRFSWIKNGYGGNESNFTYISRQPSQINSYLEFITLFFVVGLSFLLKEIHRWEQRNSILLLCPSVAFHNSSGRIEFLWKLSDIY